MSMRDEILKYIEERYKSRPEHPWKSYPDYVVFRHEDNQKWFGLIMNVPGEKLGLPGPEPVDILNVKMDDPVFLDFLVRQEGYFRGYHMNKNSWLTILLDGTISYEDVCGWVDSSYLATASKKKKEKMRPPKEWIIPANPKYYDIVHAFDGAEIIDWKQGAGIKVGDTVFMYVAAPVSAVMFQCKVMETDIPYRRKGGKVNVSALMKIQLLKRYDPEVFTFERLKNEFDVRAIRGPRGIPQTLSDALKKCL